MIRWNIIPILKEDQGEWVVELQWGWTAGMSEEQLANWAEDAPRGYDCVLTNPEMAEELRDRLTKLLEKHKKEKGC